MAEQTKTIDVQQINDNDETINKNEIQTKHPLQNEWDFWYFKPNKNTKIDNWQDNLLKIHSFNTVEDFWALYNHIELPSRLQPGSDYNLFKTGIKPMWEDPRNKQGGRLVILFKKPQSAKEHFMKEFKMAEDKIWMETCLCLIGEIFDEQSDKICGLVFNSRAKMDRISIWTNDYKDEQGIARIAMLLKERTRYNQQLFYEKHGNDSKGSKALYTI